ncbi:MAG: hypothetical protein RLZZ227_2185, partial [Pseudomonadota bacterium]
MKDSDLAVTRIHLDGFKKIFQRSPLSLYYLAKIITRPKQSTGDTYLL